MATTIRREWRTRSLAAVLAIAASAIPAAAEAQACSRTITADVAAVDHAIVYNRLGAQNVNGMLYALTRDLVAKACPGGGAACPPGPGNAQLRLDKRPRPLVLRVAAGDCLAVTLHNWLNANPNVNQCGNVPGCNPVLLPINDQVADRAVGFHPQGLELVDTIDSDSSYVGRNANSLLVLPGAGTRTYTFRAPKEGTYLVSSYGATIGGESAAGNSTSGLFAVVNVEPPGSTFYRSQLTEEEMRMATVGTTAAGQPIIDYGMPYPNVPPWTLERKAGLPIVNMLNGNEIVHSDLNAVIVGPNGDGSFPASTYPLESVSKRNPANPDRLRPFREFTVAFHDEQTTQQAFPGFYDDIVFGFRHVLAKVKDSFMINYGSGGIGSEILANRLGVGPMHDCVDCSYEEFFLTSFTVGDPAMLVDVPANAGLEGLTPGAAPTPGATGPKATVAFYPDDPSNVHHSYMGDQIKFRNVHAGREHHVFHLHNHQWLYNPNDDQSNYIDAQGLGPGSGYTYEINYRAGNRNRSAGDAIFHCHFYPHFAQGMWEHFRIHDVFEAGTRLAVSETVTGFHANPGDLRLGAPSTACDLAVDPACKPARALPDPEIVAGAPIPAVVPLPGFALPPMPGRVQVVANPNQVPPSDLRPVPPGGVQPALVAVGSNARVVDRTVNPGYPFWIAGIEDIVGQRPPTPPLDMLTAAGATALAGQGDATTNPLFFGRATELLAGIGSASGGVFGGHDGGLPRHALEGYAAGGVTLNTQTRLDMSKLIERAKPKYYPEEGTPLERVAMAYHGKGIHPSYKLSLSGSASAANFLTNGNKPMPSAPFHEPCADDKGKRLEGGTAEFLGGAAGSFLAFSNPSDWTALKPRVYKGANIQIDAVFNKVGYHYPQQRIISLWEDVGPTIAKTKAPEPFVIRFNTFDCGVFLHTNLVPAYFEMDDYQVRTPTDIIGQHIHLPKWDLTTTDGSGNGWNYEDGTLSPGTVQERIHAINCYNAPDGTGCPDLLAHPLPAGAAPVPTLATNGDAGGVTHLTAKPHPRFGAGLPTSQAQAGEYLGARTTIQRWFFDPVLDVNGVDRGLGNIFTHDHYGPSTHQQIGLYASVLTEPARSAWKHNETGVALNTRNDGGPTSWQAMIVPPNAADSYREFWYQASDFQSAYEAGVYVGADQSGRPTGVKADANTFRSAINVSHRLQNNPVFPDLYFFSALCPNGDTRPCPEAISGADPGMFVVNYRNEPVGLRVFDPARPGPDGKPGSQAAGLGGDLAYALQTRTDRAIPALNTALGGTPYPALTRDVRAGDPFTPIMRSFAGDKIRVRIQMGGHEEELSTSIHGLKWLQGGSGFGAALNSGWRNSQGHGISEQFTLSMPLTPFLGQGAQADYAYSGVTGQDGWWSGAWGLIRNYNQKRTDLAALPNGMAVPVKINNGNQFSATADGVCPNAAPTRPYDITAVLANDVLDNPTGATLVPADPSATQHVGGGGCDTTTGVCVTRPGGVKGAGGTLVYNSRPTDLKDSLGTAVHLQTVLHDPTAIMYVRTADLLARGADDPRCFVNGVFTPTNPGCPIDPACFKGVPPSFDPKQPGCPVRLTVKPEPLVLRAAAGDCIEVTLRNKLPGDLDANGFFDDLPDLGNLTHLQGVVLRDRAGLQGVTTFNNNLIRPSSHVGLHGQLVAYDVNRGDGTNVGTNKVQTVAPGAGALKMRWYAGDLSAAKDARGNVNLVATPIEFGGANLSSADKVKQGQKGMVGALIVEPQGATWTEDAGQRTAATVTAAGASHRSFAVVLQKQLSQRYSDGSAVENTFAEGVIAEDAQDSGQMAINYGSEPMWFRFGLAPNVPVGNVGANSFGGVPNAHQAYSNCLVGNQDPQTPVFAAAPGSPFEMHVLAPFSAFRGTVFNLHGHVWQRDPYVCPGDNGGGLGLAGRCNPGSLGSLALGTNPVGFYLGGQDFIHAQSHFDLVLASAGGANRVSGDYLFRDQAGPGNLGGLWGVLRVGNVPAAACGP